MEHVLVLFQRLAGQGTLAKVPASPSEAKRLIRRAARLLADARTNRLSVEGRLRLLDSAACMVASAALLRFGYRCENRFALLDCLAHITDLPRAELRALWLCRVCFVDAESHSSFDVSEDLLDDVQEVISALAHDLEAKC